MDYIKRSIEAQFEQLISQGKSILLLGPRQTGKTTLLQHIDAALTISFIQPRTRLRYERDPSLLSDEIEALAETLTHIPLIIIDEVQKAPLIMDVAQDLIDRKVAQFILTGSSARKLKRGENINLLPGRVIPLYMDPFNFTELPLAAKSLEQILTYGSLPEIALTTTETNKEELLDAYVVTYLEEEIRAEALTRNVANFARFLELAASESGYTVNFSKLSQKIGVSHTTITEYYQILEDCLVAERIDPIIDSKTRHKLSKSSKYLLFDLGVRRLAAREGTNPPTKILGQWFEQYVGLELIRYARLTKKRTTVRYWQDLNGPEVDWVLEIEKKLTPIEVKYTDSPKLSDAKHIKTFLKEYDQAEIGYVVCQTERKLKLADSIYAIPWQELHSIMT